jgi:hypothetical protein
MPLAVDGAAEASSPRWRPHARGLRSLPVLAALVLTLALSAPLVAYSLGVLLTYGSAQLGGDVYPTDFLIYYASGRMLLEQPANLYRPEVEAAVEQHLANGRDVYAKFHNLPQLAALFAPLALLPYGRSLSELVPGQRRTVARLRLPHGSAHKSALGRLGARGAGRAVLPARRAGAGRRHCHLYRGHFDVVGWPAASS